MMPTMTSNSTTYDSWLEWLEKHELLSRRQLDTALFLALKIHPSWLPILGMMDEFVAKEESVLCLNWHGHDHTSLWVEIDTNGSYSWEYYCMNNGVSMVGQNDITGEQMLEFRKNLKPAIKYGKVEVWNERLQLDTLLERYDRAYEDENFKFADGRTVAQIREELRKVDLSQSSATRDVAEILTIGGVARNRLNDSWVCPAQCSVCEVMSYDMVKFNRHDNEDYTFVCSGCIKKANEMLDNN